METATVHPNRKEAFALARKRSAWPNALLGAAIFAFYVEGIALLAYSSSWLSFAVAVAVLSQSMVWSWYLAHDCAHRLVSKRDEINLAMGEFLGLITGMAYTPFSTYRAEHFRHHADKIDLLGADLQAIVGQWPRSIVWLLSGLEKLYIPVFFYVIKWRMIRDLAVVGTARERLRLGFCLVLYLTLFLYLLSASAAALAGLLLASFVRIHLTRFVDAFQHTYDQIDPDSPLEHVRSRAYELNNTFSLPLARKHAWMNLLILNFGYHNAHHSVPSCPWYALPKLDCILASAETSAGQPVGRESAVTFRDLVTAYHVHRVHRIFDLHEGDAYDDQGVFSLRNFTGAYTDKLLG